MMFLIHIRTDYMTGTIIVTEIHFLNKPKLVLKIFKNAARGILLKLEVNYSKECV